MPPSDMTTPPVDVPWPRRRLLTWMVATVTAAAAAAAWTGQSWQSPAELALASAPPAATRLTAPVEHRVLENAVSLRGTVEGGDPFPVPAPQGAPAGTARAVVTRLAVDVGDSLGPGELMAEVSGRPIFAFLGAVPAYRDLTPGLTGDDVAQLQRSLRQAGYAVADGKGRFGASTESAVKRFYTNRGYEPATRELTPPPPPEEPSDPGSSRPDSPVAPVVPSEDQPPPATGTDSPTGEELTDAHDSDESEGDPGEQGAGGTWGVAGGQAAAVAPVLRVPSATTVSVVAAASRPVATSSAPKPRVEIYVPFSEVVFVPSLPAVVRALPLRVGDTSTGSVAVLSLGTPRVTVQVPVGTTVAPGDQVEVAVDGSETVTGTVLQLMEAASEAAPADSEVQGDAQGPAQARGSPASVVAHVSTEPPLSSVQVGRPALMTLRRAVTTGPVLAVPAAAVRTGSDGRSYVLAGRSGQEQRRVGVTTGASAQGYVQISAEQGLVVGDQVVVSDSSSVGR